MKKTIISLTLATLFIGGCVSSPAVRVSDAEGVEAVSALALTCDNPFGLEFDCSMWSGPTKKIDLGGHQVKIAGNNDGRVTVLFGENSASATQSSNLGFELMKRELLTRGFTIAKVTPIESAGLMFGYAIETTEPNYDVWNDFAVEIK